MTLNHSKTWPVSTLAVVQLRVDPNGRTYSTQMDTDLAEADVHDINHDGVNVTDGIGFGRVNKIEKGPAEEHKEEFSQEHNSKSNGVVLPLSQQHVEMFTRAHQRHPYKATVRSDTVSTILKQDFDLDSEATGNSRCKSDERSSKKFEKFHVLALAKIDEGANEGECRGRRPSVKVDNWDLIYTEREPKKTLCPACSHRCAGNAMGEYGNRKSPNDCKDRLLSDYDLPLDARKVTTLRRHYYLEGGWGWIIIVCTVLVHILNVGLQLSCSQLALPGAEKFKTLPVHIAGSAVLRIKIEPLCNRSGRTVLFTASPGIFAGC